MKIPSRKTVFALTGLVSIVVLLIWAFTTIASQDIAKLSNGCLLIGFSHQPTCPFCGRDFGPNNEHWGQSDVYPYLWIQCGCKSIIYMRPSAGEKGIVNARTVK
jgi:hypothetical protein